MLLKFLQDFQWCFLSIFSNRCWCFNYLFKICCTGRKKRHHFLKGRDNFFFFLIKAAKNILFSHLIQENFINWIDLMWISLRMDLIACKFTSALSFTCKKWNIRCFEDTLHEMSSEILGSCAIPLRSACLTNKTNEGQY